MKNTRRLVGDLLGGLELDSTSVMRTAPSMLRRKFAEQIQRDFANERSVRIDGWVLSQSEAQLCALAALCPNRKS